MSIASIGKTRLTTGPTCASAAPTGANTGLSRSGQAMWFAATYGDPHNARRRIECARLDTERFHSVPPGGCPNRRSRGNFSLSGPTVDHFNRDYKPELGAAAAELKSAVSTRATEA